MLNWLMKLDCEKKKRWRRNSPRLKNVLKGWEKSSRYLVSWWRNRDSNGRKKGWRQNPLGDGFAAIKTAARRDFCWWGFWSFSIIWTRTCRTMVRRWSSFHKGPWKNTGRNHSGTCFRVGLCYHLGNFGVAMPRERQSIASLISSASIYLCLLSFVIRSLFSKLSYHFIVIV